MKQINEMEKILSDITEEIFPKLKNQICESKRYNLLQEILL